MPKIVYCFFMFLSTLDSYNDCKLCPRFCGIPRTKGVKGFCRETSALRIASAGLHFGEEPPITAAGGSGTIFITGCNLRCAFCQNYQISQKEMGSIVSEEDFSSMCLVLQEKGAENINIVTGSHAVPSIALGLEKAKIDGLTIPVCWNSSAYETVETLSMLDGLVDLWLPDLKTLNPIISDAVFKAADYPKYAKKAVRWMADNRSLSLTQKSSKEGKLIEKMLSGTIVRHLVLPGRLDDTILVLDWFKRHLDGKAYLSLMTQYTPVPSPDDMYTPDEKCERCTSLSSFQNRFLNETEFSSLVNLLNSYELEQVFYQELSTDTDWLPDFNLVQPFSNALARPLWHWKKGFLD